MPRLSFDAPRRQSTPNRATQITRDCRQCLGGCHAETSPDAAGFQPTKFPKRRGSGGARRRGHAVGCRQCHAGRSTEQRKAALPGPRQIAAETMAPPIRSGESDLERRRLHGRRAQVARHRVFRDQLRVELSRPARSRWSITAATPSRKSSPACMRTSPCIWRRVMPRSMASRWQWRCHGVGRSAARHHGDVQRLVRPRAGHRDSAATSWRPTSARQAPNGCMPASTSAQIVREFTKWDDQPASLQHFAESVVRAYKIATTPPMGPVFLSLDGELQENPIRDRGKSAHSQVRAGRSAARQFRGDRRSGQDAGRSAEPGHRRRPRRAHACRHGEPRGACRDAAMRRHRQCRPHEFPVAPSAQSKLPPRADRAGRRHSRHRDERSLGHADAFQRPYRAPLAAGLQARAPRS